MKKKNLSNGAKRKYFQVTFRVITIVFVINMKCEHFFIVKSLYTPKSYSTIQCYSYCINDIVEHLRLSLTVLNSNSKFDSKITINFFLSNE